MLNHSILMDFIDGAQLKQIANEVGQSKLKKMSAEFGRIIAMLHRGNMVHGDPTTSNILVDKNEKLWMIDFGLAEMNATVEMKGVDLHLIRRALETTHWELEDTMLEAAIKGYSKLLGTDAEGILTRMEDIRERGRYH
jgi:TP53 regulating kinase-like protein